MMEAAIIVLSIVAAAGWTAYLWAWSRISDAEWKARVSDASADFWEASYRDAVKRIAPFDHDGDGKPGGSKPRGKG